MNKKQLISSLVSTDVSSLASKLFPALIIPHYSPSPALSPYQDYPPLFNLLMDRH